MPARLAISSTNVHGQYVGTTRVPAPSATPGSSTCRQFNGLSDRLLLGPSNALGANFLAVLSFWRGDTSVLPDNQTSARLFTQYAVGGTRIAAGLNGQGLSITFTEAAGSRQTVQVYGTLQDTARHTLALAVQGDDIRLWLDGRLALQLQATLAAPDLARVCVGADTASRFFKGFIDDLAVYKVWPSKTQGWLNYYQDLLLSRYRRDYLATPFAGAVNGAAISGEGFQVQGLSVSPTSRVALSQPWRDDEQLPLQVVELRFKPGSGELRVGVIGPGHDLAEKAPGETAHSYGFTQQGRLRHDAQEVLSGLAEWTTSSVISLRWQAPTRALEFWVDGVFQTSLTLPAGQWTVALSLAGNTAFLNSGQTTPFALGSDAPPLPLHLWSQLTTEFRHAKLGEVCAPLDDLDNQLRDAYTGATVGSYSNPLPLEASFTGDPYDFSRRVGDNIKVTAASFTAADDSFFFALAFSPEAADLVGEVSLLHSPGKWSLQLIDGRLNATVGGVQVGSVNAPFAAGGCYLIGVARSAAGRLLVWCHLGYIMQSGDTTVPQTAADVYVGSQADGSRKFSGRLSHLLLAGTQPARWKLDRLRNAVAWSTPDVQGAMPNPPSVRRIYELSWWEVITAGIATEPNSVHCYVGSLAVPPDEVAVEYRPVDRKGASPFTGDTLAVWTASAPLDAPLTRTGTVLTFPASSDLSVVQPGDALQVNEETLKVESVNNATKVITVKRACGDTVRAEHGAGSRVWFLGHPYVTGNPYLALDRVEVKLLSRSYLAEMGEEFAPTDTIDMRGRLARPYPPALVEVNGQYWPESLHGTLLITWRHRNKLAQAGSLFAEDEGDFSAQPGVTYLVRAFDAVSGDLLHTSSPIPGTESSYHLLVEGFSGQLRVSVTSELSGLSCWQAQERSFSYVDELPVVITTEEGEPLEGETSGGVMAESYTALQVNSYDGELPDDWAGFEEEEEEEEGGAGYAGQVLGVKISEFAQLPTEPSGDELFPVAYQGTNYYLTAAQYRDWLASVLPPPQDGKSAYQTWLDLGNTGSEADFISSLVGAQGLNSNAARRIQVVSSASGALICDWEAYDEIRLRLTGPTTLTFQGAKDGQGCLLKITQDAAGAHSLTLPPSVRYNALVQQYTATPTPGLSDKIGFIFDGGDSTYDFVTFVPGFS